VTSASVHLESATRTVEAHIEGGGMARVGPGDPIIWLVTRQAVSGYPSDTLREAAERLAEEAIGVLVVVNPQGLAGIVSERDIVRGLAEGADPDVERVADVMTDVVLQIESAESVSGVAATMLANEIRHAVVTDGDSVAGVVSIRDVLGVLLRSGRSELAER
jgi:CBS domain-containing protein